MAPITLFLNNDLFWNDLNNDSIYIKIYKSLKIEQKNISKQIPFEVIDRIKS